jgi:hypothetical protein
LVLSPAGAYLFLSDTLQSGKVLPDLGPEAEGPLGAVDLVLPSLPLAPRPTPWTYGQLGHGRGPLVRGSLGQSRVCLRRPVMGQWGPLGSKGLGESGAPVGPSGCLGSSREPVSWQPNIRAPNGLVRKDDGPGRSGAKPGSLLLGRITMHPPSSCCNYSDIFISV